MCCAENEELSVWEPLHFQHGTAAAWSGSRPNVSAYKQGIVG
jgi:hypothetical protein